MSINNNINILVKATDNATKPLQNIQGAFSNLSNKINSISSKILQVTSVAFWWLITAWVSSAKSLETTRTAFTNLYWSADKAWKTIEKLVDFSNKTPFEMPWVADNALKLQNIAWIADNELIPTLTKLWDIASSQWRDLWQITEAYLDAITWENERLKEFWITAKDNWDTVIYTFRWISTEVAKTKEWIGEYLNKIWEMQGIQWSMAQQSNTLTWLFSTFSDTISSLTRNLVWMSDTWEIIKWWLLDKMKIWLQDVSLWINTNKEDIKNFWDNIMIFWIQILDIVVKLWEFILKNQELVKDIWIWIWIIYLANTAFTLMTTVITLTTTAINICTTATGFLKAAFILLSSTPIGLLITWLTALATTWYLVYKNWDLLKQKAIELWTYILNLYENHKILFSIFAPMIAIWIELYKNWDLLKQKASELWTFLTENFTILKDAVISIFDAMWQAITDTVFSSIEKVKSYIQWAIDFANNAMKLITNIFDKAKNLKNSVVETAGNIWSSISNAVSWTRALWWTVQSWKTYLVWEKWPEIFTAGTTWTITPNNQIWTNWGVNISINMWWVTVNNKADADYLTNKVIEKITRQLQLNKIGIS